MAAIYSCAYFPGISYIASMLRQKEIKMEKWENYIRQSYRSRCYINGANGVIPLIVPVERGRKKTLISTIKIANKTDWKEVHLKSIMSAYGKAPFYDHYIEQIASFLRQDHEYLYDLCMSSLSLCLKMLKLNLSWQETLTYVSEYESDHIDYRNAFMAKKSQGSPKFYKPREYFQLFGKKFVEDLSVLDLIFCEGPQAAVVVRASFKEG